MPIIGMTRREDITPKFPDLGKLRKGAQKGRSEDGKPRPGQDLEYWRFTSDRPEIVAAFYAAYPAEPKTIHAYLPFPTQEENWQTWREEYDAGGLVHRCDGQTVTRWRDSAGEYQDRPVPCPYASGQQERTRQRPGCGQVGRLTLIIPELIEAGHVGFVTMETHSINDLVSITACLTDIENHSQNGLTGILFHILRVPEVISTPAWDGERRAAGKRNRTTKTLVQVVPASRWVQAQLNKAQALALPGDDLLALTDGGDLPDDADETIDAETVIATAAADKPAATFTLPGIDAEFEAAADAEFASIPAGPNSIHAASAPEPPPTTAKKLRPAGIAGGMVSIFNEWAAEFAEKYPYWQTEDGLADRVHLLFSIAKVGHSTITADNWEQIKAEMVDRVAAKAAE